jgi:hypothetical protein
MENAPQAGVPVADGAAAEAPAGTAVAAPEAVSENESVTIENAEVVE